MDATFLRAPFSGPETSLPGLPMQFPTFLPMQLDGNNGDLAKRRKIDGPAIKQEPGQAKVGEASNLPAVAAVPAVSDIAAVRFGSYHFHFRCQTILYRFSAFSKKYKEPRDRKHGLLTPRFAFRLFLWSALCLARTVPP